MITRNTDYSIQRLRGLSTDTKPTDVPNGSEFREMDTGKKFLYSAAGKEWIEQPCCGGGSGGGGSVEPLIVRLTAESEYTTMDKTYQEIHDSLFNGTPAYLLVTNVNNSVSLFSIIQCVAGHGCEVHVDVGGSAHNIYSARTVDDYPTTGK